MIGETSFSTNDRMLGKRKFVLNHSSFSFRTFSRCSFQFFNFFFLLYYFTFYFIETLVCAPHPSKMWSRIATSIGRMTVPAAALAGTFVSYQLAQSPFSTSLFAENRERTYVMVKPDGVQRHLVGEIISRFERRGYKVVGIKMLVPSRNVAESHYAEHKERPFFKGLVEFLTSGPVVALVIEGDGAVATARSMIGQTKPQASAPGTIRGDFGIDVGRNIIHGSDSVDSANREIGLWFKDEEIAAWTSSDAKWTYEK